MSAPIPVEAALLSPTEKILDRACRQVSAASRYELRLQILEAAASRLGGFDHEEFNGHFGIFLSQEKSSIELHAAAIVASLGGLVMHPAMALSALSREPLDAHARRSSGAHHTDFRLARLIGRKAAALNVQRRPIVDPASGAGILLVATTLEMCGLDRKAITSWLAESVHASDVSASALRGARLALASLTDDLDAIVRMVGNWNVGDSLLRPEGDWLQQCPTGYGVVVANPPWEKLKILRHEFEVAAGTERHYGSDHHGEVPHALAQRRGGMHKYAKLVGERYPLAASGEVDLFAAFTELILRLAGPDGAIAALLPAGLIRSKSTTALRKELIGKLSPLEFTVIDNRARFFAIDTRFKFLAVSGARNSSPPAGRKVGISYCATSDEECEEASTTQIPIAKLRSLRPDLTVPEVRGPHEWRLFQQMARRGTRWCDDESPWVPDFCREIDMTRERRFFLAKAQFKALPVVEGRMVHQHRFGAKRYVSGSGRRAVWSPTPIGKAAVAPQHWIAADHITGRAADRAFMTRAGFCDIAGQTNERSMMAAIIPAGVVCGNKVPTVTFPRQPGEEALHLWCGMVNSFAFDWLLRRVLTTTVNYFLVQSVPLPPVTVGSLPGRRIVDAVKSIQALDVSGGGCDAAWRVAELRSRIDVLCFKAYGLAAIDVEIIMSDFSSLDRAQPPLPSERRSTITKDFVVSAMVGGADAHVAARVEHARALGAVPYISSQNGEKDIEEVPAFG